VTDDLTAPLGQERKQRWAPAIPVAALWAAAGLLGGFAALFLGWAIFADAPFGGEPMAVVRADLRADRAGPEPKPADDSRRAVQDDGVRPNRYDGPSLNAGQPVSAGQPVNAGQPAASMGNSGQNTVTIIDGTSGNRKEVLIPAQPADKSGSDPYVDQRFAEASRHGAIPKIALDGTRPSEAFAQPVKALAGKPNAPRIAIVVAGLGISASGTRDALAKLPGPVTLAFAPYGADLERLAARARDGGHELLLQVPMEPFDYPDNDPGPQTLLTSLEAEQNVDRLRWLMSRLQGYVGIANYMGARFMTAAPALAPVLRETAKRGLIFVEDGSAPRSLAGEIAGANNLPFAKADLVIDAVPAAADIDRALARLEKTARERGSAVGMANALPASIERIAAWAKAAEGRGIALVPISAVAPRTKSS
jgi:polysaccharide deacetylase 2 family uncharacterized protein YibQ